MKGFQTKETGLAINYVGAKYDDGQFFMAHVVGQKIFDVNS